MSNKTRLEATEIIEAQQREIAMLRQHNHLAADNVGDWRELHQHWQVAELKLEEAVRVLSLIARKGTDYPYRAAQEYFESANI